MLAKCKWKRIPAPRKCRQFSLQYGELKGTHNEEPALNCLRMRATLSCIRSFIAFLSSWCMSYGPRTCMTCISSHSHESRSTRHEGNQCLHKSVAAISHRMVISRRFTNTFLNQRWGKCRSIDLSIKTKAKSKSKHAVLKKPPCFIYRINSHNGWGLWHHHGYKIEF